MAGLVTFGIAQGADGHEVAQRAVQQALTGLGSAKPVFGLVFVPQAFEIKGTLAGLTGSLGNTPLWGFNTSETISSAGVSPNHLVIAIFAGNDWKVEMVWLPEFSQNPAAAGKQILAALEKNPGWKNVLIAADGLNGETEKFDSALEAGPWGIAGGLAGSVRLNDKPVVFGGKQAAEGAAIAALLGGKLRMGVGWGHGWRETGLFFSITQIQENRISLLDEASPAETYSHVFGYPVNDWLNAPLKEMVRLYPFGIEQVDASQVVRSPLFIDPDGSLRMNAAISKDSIAHLLIGDSTACVQAARDAARKALRSIGKARPVLAIVLIDCAWQALFEAQPEKIVDTIRSQIGAIPLIGAYTVGQIVKDQQTHDPVQILNQHIEIIVLAEGQE